MAADVANARTETGPRKDLGATGHRQRLRQRLLSADGEPLSEIDLLELLLCFAIPRKDMRPLAKSLLQRFGSLPCVVAADREALQAVEGLGEASLALIALVERLRTRETTVPGAGAPFPPAPRLQLGLFPPPGESAIPVADEVPADLSLPNGATGAARTQPAQHRTIAPRRGTGLFARAALKEAIALLPQSPDTEDLTEIGRYLRRTLPFSAEKTRSRHAEYIIRRMFPLGYADRALRQFAHRYAGTPALRDVCYYRFVKAEPLMMRIAEALLWPNLGAGCLPRQALADFVATNYPAIRSVADSAWAIADALKAGGIARADRRQMMFALREPSLPAFAFVLHSEFPEPGSHDLAALEGNAVLRALLWREDQVLPAMYELRNQGLITRVTEIDRLRQFTTRLTLDEAVERMVTERI